MKTFVCSEAELARELGLRRQTLADWRRAHLDAQRDWGYDATHRSRSWPVAYTVEGRRKATLALQRSGFFSQIFS